MKHYLEQIRFAKSLIESKEREKKELILLLGSLSSPSMGDRVKNSSRNSAMFAVDNVLYLQTQIDDEILNLTHRWQDAHNLINRLPNLNERSILTDKYINGISFNKIADNLHYSMRNVFKIHERGLKSALKFIEVQ